MNPRPPLPRPSAPSAGPAGPTTTSARYLLGLSLLAACAGDTTDCGVTSTHPRFLPHCDDARIVFHPEETRFALGGEDQAGDAAAVVAYLPPAAGSGTYGGTTGNYLALLLDLADGELAPDDRNTTLTIVSLDDDEAQVGISAVFERGEISGALVVPVVGN